MDFTLAHPAANPADEFASLPPGVPEWVFELGGSGAAAHDIGGPFELQITEWPAHALVRVVIGNAVNLNAPALEKATAEAYGLIAAELKKSPAPHAIRCWNYIPRIHDAMGEGIDRYMVFNAGRFNAFSRWYGNSSGHNGNGNTNPPVEFDRSVATASGVGYFGRDLHIHVLAGAEPGKAVTNPRQVAPYRYSRRFGPRPPCFARATLVHPSTSRDPILLVGGTASVRGEESVHDRDLPGQLAETFQNLCSLLDAAIETGTGKTAPPATAATDVQRLGLFRDLRVYYVRSEYHDLIAAAVRASFPGLRRLEMMPADLCRRELLVEIEGIAELSG